MAVRARTYKSSNGFDQILLDIPIPGFALDQNGLVKFFNSALVEVFGRSPIVDDPADRFLGSFKFSTKNGTPSTFEEIFLDLAFSAESTSNEFILEREDETRRHLKVSRSLLEHDSGEPAGNLVFLEDKTEELVQKAKVNEFSQALEQARALNLNKNTFITTLAHELRNALVPIVCGTELLKVKGGAVEQNTMKVLADRMFQQSQHIVRLVEDLNDYSAMTLGKLALDLEPIELVSICRDAIEQVRPLVSGGLRNLKVDLPDASIYVLGDKTRMFQIVSNLLSNAVKFTTVEGTIEISCVDSKDGHANVVVRDNGIGIDAADQANIFDLFVQQSNSHSQCTAGLGIGLALSRELARLQNGSLDVKSEGAGTGSEFVIRFKRVNQNDLNENSGVFDVLQSQVRVLLVDDNESVSVVMRSMLEAINCRVVVANKGTEGIELYKEFQPHIVFCDIAMPGMNGFEFVDGLRKIESEDSMPYLIAFSGNTLPEQISQILASGFNTHLCKPARLKELQKVIAAAVLAQK